MRRLRRILTCAVVVPLIGTLIGTPQAAADPAPPPPPANVQSVAPVPPLPVPPNGSVSVDKGPNKALQPINPLPAVDPANATVPIDRAPVVPKPPVAPVPLTLPQQPAQVLVDATAKDALDTLGRAGRLTPQNTPDLDATKLQPQVSSAQVFDPSRPATLQELIDALLSGNIPPPLPVDPLALLNQLPDGIPRITYRVCSESRTKAVSCSLTLPLGVPAIVDVTGDRTPDVLADLLPAVAVGEIVGPVREIINLDKQIADATSRLNAVLELLKDPLQVILHPELLVEKLQLEELLTTLRGTVQQKLEALLKIINVGLAMLELKLPTSETWGKDLGAHVWAVYDIPGRKRLSLGYDGMRRGSSLPTGTLGIFTLNPIEALRGVYDIKATLLQAGAGESLAITAGMSSVREDDKGDAYDPTVASARFSPVPNIFDAHARIDPGDDKRNQQGSVDATSNKQTALDTIVLSNSARANRFTQLKVDKLPTKVAVELTRTPSLPSLASTATVKYNANSVIDTALFADYVYQPNQALKQAVQATAAAIPTSFTGALTPADVTTLDYTANGQLASLDANVYDSDGIILRGALRQLPTAVKLVADNPKSHLTFDAAQPLGSASIDASRNFAPFAPVDGDHATLILRDKAIGISARVTGLKSVDAFYDAHPRVKTVFEPGGQPFFAGGDVNNINKVQASITNLPKQASIDIDPVARKLAYRATEVIHRVHAAFTNTANGPTIVGAVNELPTSVDVSYDLGDRPHLLYEASSKVARVEFFASQQPIENLNPTGHQYLSAAANGIPTKADLLLDFPKRHLQGELSDPLDSVAVVARFPVAGRDWLALGELAGIPKQFDADFAEGMFRFRGISGPLAAAKFTATNHAGATTPTGLHLAAHYTQSKGDLDGSVSVRNLSHVEYSKTAAGQTFRLDTDTGGDPVFADVNVLLRPAGATEGPDDTQLAAFARVDNLPTTLQVDYADGKLTYSANKNIGLAIEARLGKLAALNGLGAPVFPNGVAGVARGCDNGPGCTKDDSPFCTAFARCLGLVGTVSLPGLPTKVVVDTKAKTVNLTGYRPPAAPLQAYVRLTGLIDALPDARALATLSGLPSPLDLTVGPVDVNGSTMDFRYTASAPLGTLRLDADLTTTNAQFPALRGRATLAKLPASMHLTGQFGERTLVGIHNSAPVDNIGVIVTSPTTGYLSASVDSVPANVDVNVDLKAKHVDSNASAPLGAVTVLAHVPYEGRTWSVFGQVTNVPAKFDADFTGGLYRFRGLSGPLGSVAFAATNHGGATAPTGPHLAVHFRESTGDIDASALLTGLSLVEYTQTGSDFTAKFNANSQRIAYDADVVRVAPGTRNDDVRYAALGHLGPIPSSIKVSSTKGVVKYDADKAIDFEAQLFLGKVAALNGIGAPRMENGISAVDRRCDPGAGCVTDDSPFCAERGCFGITSIITLSGLPPRVEIDLNRRFVGALGYQPKVNKIEVYVDDSVLAPKPLNWVRAKVAVTGLSLPVDLSVGPISVTNAGIDVSYLAFRDGVLRQGRLDVLAQADLEGFGDTRALTLLDPAPALIHLKAKFGNATHIDYETSSPISTLEVRASTKYEGADASGQVRVTDVPRKFTLDAGVKPNGAGINLPTLAYNNPNPADGALDGLIEVDARLSKKVGPISGAVDDLMFDFTDLGAQTTASFNPDTLVAQLTSTPATGRIHFRGSVFVSAIPEKQIDFTKFVHVTGSFRMDDSSLEGIDFAFNDVSKIEIVPGTGPFGIDVPKFVGFALPMLRGDYGDVTIKIEKVAVNIHLKLKVDLIVGEPEVTLEPFDKLMFHRYDLQCRKILTMIGGDIHAIPSQAEERPNEIVLRGAEGPQSLLLLDPVVKDQNGNDVGKLPFAVHRLLAWSTWPVAEDKKIGQGGC